MVATGALKRGAAGGPDAASALRLLCWNVNGVQSTLRLATARFGSLGAFFRSLGADVVCLQETKTASDLLTRQLAVVEGYQSYWSFAATKRGYSGVAVFCDATRAPAWAASFGESVRAGGDEDREGRCIEADLGAFVLINVYVPNSGEPPLRARAPAKVRFLRALAARVRELRRAGREALVVGDMNVARTPADAHPSVGWGELYGDEELEALEDLFRACEEEEEMQREGGGRKGKGVGEKGGNEGSGPEGKGIKGESDEGKGLATEETSSPPSSPPSTPRRPCPHAPPPTSDLWRLFHPLGGRAASGRWRQTLPASGATPIAPPPHASSLPDDPRNRPGYTCWDQITRARIGNRGVRIDYAIATPAVRRAATGCAVLSSLIPEDWSDHAGLLVELRVQRGTAGEGEGTGEGGEVGAPGGSGELPQASPSGLRSTPAIALHPLVLPPLSSPPPAPKAWLDLEGRFVDRAQRSLSQLWGGGGAKKAGRGGKATSGGGGGGRAEKGGVRGGTDGSREGEGERQDTARGAGSAGETSENRAPESPCVPPKAGDHPRPHERQLALLLPLPAAPASLPFSDPAPAPAPKGQKRSAQAVAGKRDPKQPSVLDMFKRKKR